MSVDATADVPFGSFEGVLETEDTTPLDPGLVEHTYYARGIRHTDRMARPRLVGINHVAIEVGDVEEALAFYRQVFELSLRGRAPGAAFVDMGDQFVAVMEGRSQPPDRARHFGLVVDDKEETRRALAAAGAEILPGRGLDFLDPWGNHVQVVQYDEVQFSKAGRVLRGMGLDLGKTGAALAELRSKGLA